MPDLIRVPDHCTHMRLPIRHRAWLITAQIRLYIHPRGIDKLVHVFLWFAVSLTSLHQDTLKHVPCLRLVELR